jgi:DNA-3-methyladenine glycosylase II
MKTERPELNEASGPNTNGKQILQLDEERYLFGLETLAWTDPDLGRVLSEFGKPPMWAREPGFPTLVQIILEQQVSLASARSVYEKLQQAVQPFSAESFSELTPRDLMELGVTRQKAGYCVGLAQSIVGKEIDLHDILYLPDQEAKNILLKIKGIGPWTADIYLLMALRRQDVWPSGDLALASALQTLKSLSTRPGIEDQHRIASAWKPWRAVAARILWHYYLSR